MISSRRFFLPESCVRQFAETSGKDTFTAWARNKDFSQDESTLFLKMQNILQLFLKLLQVAERTTTYPNARVLLSFIVGQVVVLFCSKSKNPTL
jgi:hypothetical protein